MITLGGAGGGLALGLLLVGFKEYRESSLKTEQDVMRLCQLPVLASVPLMVSVQERRAERRRSLLTHAGAVVVVLVCVAVIAFATLPIR